MRQKFLCSTVFSLVSLLAYTPVWSRDFGVEIVSCVTAIRNAYEPALSVTYPEEFVADCPGGRPSDQDGEAVGTIAVSYFVQAGNLDPASSYSIVSASYNIIQNDPQPPHGPDWENLTVSPGGVTFKVTCHTPRFGPGKTAKFKVVAVLKEVMTDRKAAGIARICNAAVFHPSAP
jgi:hypothetical protein